MENSKLELGTINGDVFVFIEKKKIKNVHLKVYRDLTVKLSVPEKVPDDWIKRFLEKRKGWINKQIFKYKESSGNNTLVLLKNGCSVQLLGKDFRIYIKQGKKSIELLEKKINIYIDDAKNLEKATKYFDKWWNSFSEKLYKEKIKNYYDTIFRKYGVQYPSIQIRKMKTMWGNCNPLKSIIRLNKYLTKASELGVEYVIMHEMTHLLYPRHNAEFYNFMTIQMPDWKDRKLTLDLEVVQGL